VQGTGGFLPFLPQDAGSDGGDPAAEEVVALISDDLAALLRAGTQDFWAALERDASLRTCLDSYLQHCRHAHQDQNQASLELTQPDRRADRTPKIGAGE
jgi:hypothetical protein